jgi:hypothetical protein
MTILNDYIFDSPYALNAKHNPIRYFTHLSSEDQKFVLTNFDKFIDPLEKECPRFSFVTQDANESELVYRPLHIIHSFLTAKENPVDIKLCTHYEGNQVPRVGVGMDLALLRDTYEIDTNGTNINMLYKCQKMIVDLEFSGLSDVITIINAAGEIFNIMGKSDISTLFAGIQETLDMLHAFIDIKVGVEITYWDTLTDLLRNFEGSVFYIPDKDNEFMLNYILMTVVAIYGFCGDLKKDGINEEIWNGYLMKVVRESYGSRDDAIRKKFQNLIDIQSGDYIKQHGKEFLSTNKNIMKFAREEDLDIIHDKVPVKQIDLFEDTLTSDEKIGYRNLERMNIDDIKDTIADKIGLQADRISIGFDIPEELLAMYMSEFNCIAPLHVVGDQYLLKYCNNIYKLFMISTNGTSSLAAIAVDRDDHIDGTLDLSLLSFTKNKDYKYVFIY